MIKEKRTSLETRIKGLPLGRSGANGRRPIGQPSYAIPEIPRFVAFEAFHLCKIDMINIFNIIEI